MDSLQEMFYGKPKTEESEEKKNGEDLVPMHYTHSMPIVMKFDPEIFCCTFLYV